MRAACVAILALWASRSVQAGGVRQAKVDEDLVVVVPKGASTDAIEKLVRARIAAAHLDAQVAAMPAPPSPSDDSRTALAAENPKLSAADVDTILHSPAIAMRATGEPIATMRALGAIALDAAKAAHGWVVDPLAGAAYTPAQFASHVPGAVPDVRKLIYVHGVSGDNAPPFLDTMGMSKLGFPELRVSVAAQGQLEALTVLIDAAAQAMLAKGDAAVPGTLDVDFAKLPGEWHVADIEKAGGSARASWQLRWTTDPDSGAREIELVPAQGSGAQGAAALIDSCFGKVPEPIAQVRAGDPELAAAAVQARKALVAERAHFARGVPPNEHLAIKAPFHDGEITEWMWVDVYAWKGDTFEGTLDSEPEDVKNVKLGERVRIKLSDVADFIHVHADASQTGGFSIAVFKKRGAIQ